MHPKEICKQLNPSAFTLTLNESLPNLNMLTDLLTENNIPFEKTKSAKNISLQRLQMGFGTKCVFQDVYYLAQLFKGFGLQTVYPSNNKSAEIQFGTYLYKFPRKLWADFILGDPMNIHTFLEIDPATTMKDVMDLHFDDAYRTAYSDEKDRDKPEDADAYDGSSELDENRLDDAFEEEDE